MSTSFGPASPVFERTSIISNLCVALDSQPDTKSIRDIGSGRNISIDTPINEIPPMRAAAIHCSHKRFESNTKFRDNPLSVYGGVITSCCGETIREDELQRIDNADLAFIDTVMREFPIADLVTWGGLTASKIPAFVPNNPPTAEEIRDMNAADNFIDSEKGKFLLLFTYFYLKGILLTPFKI